MGFENDFLDLMPHTVLRTAYSSIDGYGKPTFSTVNSSYAARVTYKQKLVKATDGSERISTAQVVLNCTASISVNDKFTLPDGTNRPILAIEQYSDSGGTHHSKIFFG